MIRIEDATKSNAVKAFEVLLDARPKPKRMATLPEAVMVETVMMTALSYLEHALPALDESKDEKMHVLAAQIRVMLEVK